jgi:hypothetical protein
LKSHGLVTCKCGLQPSEPMFCIAFAGTISSAKAGTTASCKHGRGHDKLQGFSLFLAALLILPDAATSLPAVFLRLSKSWESFRLGNGLTTRCVITLDLAVDLLSVFVMSRQKPLQHRCGADTNTITYLCLPTLSPFSIKRAPIRGGPPGRTALPIPSLQRVDAAQPSTWLPRFPVPTVLPSHSFFLDRLIKHPYKNALSFVEYRAFLSDSNGYSSCSFLVTSLLRPISLVLLIIRQKDCNMIEYL